MAFLNSKTLKSFSFGVNKEMANVNINSIAANPFVEIQFSNHLIQTHLIGLYNANNINAALTIGKYFGVDDLEIKEALESYIPENNRSQLITKGTNQIILDAYNANPSSMSVAVENFLQLNDSNKIMILGDMFELGNESPQEHKVLIDFLNDKKDVVIYFIGKEFYNQRTDSANYWFFETFNTFSEYLSGNKIENSSILIKGSRGMALERTLQFL